MLVRLLTRDRSWIATFVLSALGFAAVAPAVTVVNALWFKALPFPAADRLYALQVAGPSWSPALLEAFRREFSVFRTVAGIQERTAILGNRDASAPIRLESVSAEYFELFGARPVAGRAFLPEEDQRGRPVAVAVVSHALARRLAPGRDELPSPIVVDGRTLQVVGVMPPGFSGLIGRTDVWVPLAAARWLEGDTGPERPSSRWFEVVGRAPEGVSGEVAAKMFAGDAERAVASIPNGAQMFGTNRARIAALDQQMSSPVIRQAGAWLLGAAVLLLILIAANLAALHLASALSREREVAIRRAIGASDARLAREAALRAGVPLALGLAAALLMRTWLVDVLLALRPPSERFGIASADPFTSSAIALDGRAIAVLAVLFAGVWTLVAAQPILRARRATLLAGARPSRRLSWAPRRRLPEGSALLTAQLALAAAVVACSGVMVKSSMLLSARERGFDPDGVVSMRLSLPGDAESPAQRSALYESLVERVASRSDVESAGIVSCVPGGGRCRRSSVARVDGVSLPHGSALTFGVHFATTNALEALGARLVAGRGFSPADRIGSEPVAIVSESAARRMWPGQSPIGRRVAMFFANGQFTEDRLVVGVLRDIEYDAVDDSAPGDIYFPAGQAAWNGLAVVRTAAPVPEVLQWVAGRLADVEPDAVAFDVATLRDRLHEGLANERFVMTTLASFAAMALLLAIVGAFALTRVTMARRRRDIGIALALGATRRRVYADALGSVGLVAVFGTLGGLAGALWLVQWLASLAHGVAVRDLGVFALAAATLLSAPIAGAAGPAWRAARTNPVDVFRSASR